LINKHPFQDIVIVLYLFFAVGLVDIGKQHFWVVVTNLSLAFCKSMLCFILPMFHDSCRVCLNIIWQYFCSGAAYRGGKASRGV
jgi:hypothetical protein